ncbi:hypothetical protein ACN6LC_004664 [Streptomyces violaceoruber]|uniref:hypothetical protein n=1 Tax=Streptomyces violaceoruber TaxID=1935 RepID=UPI00403C594D
MAGVTGPPGMSGVPGTDSAGSAPPDRSGGGFRAVAFDAGAFAAVAFFLVGLVFFASAISHFLNQVLDLEAILCRTRFPRPADTPNPPKVVLARIKANDITQTRSSPARPDRSLATLFPATQVRTRPVAQLPADTGLDGELHDPAP